jgi:hypothetical protein
MSGEHRELFRYIAEADRRELWRDCGAWDMASWLSMRYGISCWKARRWIACAHALEDLPVIGEAFSSGDLGVDKVVELTRLATPESESALLRWAEGVSAAAIRHRGDLAAARPIPEVRDVEHSRSVSWSYHDEGRRFGLHADLPAAQGPVVAGALDRLARDLPVMPGEEDPYWVGARRADALVAVCSAHIAADADPDRAAVVLHARLDGVMEETGGCEIEGGPVIHPHTARRLLCTARVQVVVEDGGGQPLVVRPMTSDPPRWMIRHLKYRDRECTFPGCGARRFLQAHHIVWRRHGGRTDLENLILTCFFHHRLVHEYGWTVQRDPDGTVRWFHPDGTRYRAGPGPPVHLPSASDLWVGYGSVQSGRAGDDLGRDPVGGRGKGEGDRPPGSRHRLRRPVPGRYQRRPYHPGGRPAPEAETGPFGHLVFACHSGDRGRRGGGSGGPGR